MKIPRQKLAQIIYEQQWQRKYDPKPYDELTPQLKNHWEVEAGVFVRVLKAVREQMEQC